MVLTPWLLSAGLFTMGVMLTGEQEGNPGSPEGFPSALRTSSGHEGGLDFTGSGRKGMARGTCSGRCSGCLALWLGCVIRPQEQGPLHL